MVPDDGDHLVTDDDWADIWANLSPGWRRVLHHSDTDTPPPAGPIVRRRRLTTDYWCAWTFEPIRYLPALTQALLWDENGMDLGPLTGRSWQLLQLAGPANIELDQLAGTTVTQLNLAVVDVADMSPIRDITGLKSLTLAYGTFGPLPPLDNLTDLTIHTQVDIDLTAVQRNPGLRITRTETDYFPPFGPDDVAAR
ncbi:hypothetical protein ACFQZZ_00905 [Nocardia sp. GCM10030253]|uniref:hypothetical protein n=1 Tax=Nocardia sp. GCM10030253 TaxID=3273404 RepID=UPI003638E868